MTKTTTYILALTSITVGAFLVYDYVYLGSIGLGWDIIIFLFLFVTNLLYFGVSKWLNMNNQPNFILANIPFAVAYFLISISFLSTLRVHIKNEGGRNIDNIKIYGCDAVEISSLQEHEEALAFIDIPTDCAVRISYEVNGVKYDGVMIGYATSSMGQVIRCTIKDYKNIKEFMI